MGSGHCINISHVLSYPQALRDLAFSYKDLGEGAGNRPHGIEQGFGYNGFGVASFWLINGAVCLVTLVIILLPESTSLQPTARLHLALVFRPSLKVGHRVSDELIMFRSDYIPAIIRSFRSFSFAAYSQVQATLGTGDTNEEGRTLGVLFAPESLRLNA